MELDQLQQHYTKIRDFLLKKYNQDANDPNLKYKQMIKVQEELGELAEQILKSDNLQRSEKGSYLSEDLVYEYFDVLSSLFVFGRMLNIDIAAGLVEKTKQIMEKHGVS